MSDGVGWPEFEQWLLAHGLDPRDIAEIVWRPPHAGAGYPNENKPQCLEVLTYLRNEDGHRYRDPATGEAATETRVVPMLHLPAVEAVRVLYQPAG
jgi:hypothetical protein